MPKHKTKPTKQPKPPSTMPDSSDPAAAKPDPDMPPRRPAGGGKLRKPLSEKQRAAAEQRLAHLRSHLRLHPFVSHPPTPSQEPALRALGLLDFARLGPELSAAAPRPDLVAPLLAYHDPARRRSFVRGARVSVSRADLARALSLPPKPSPAATAPPDADASSGAVMEFMHAHVLLPFQGDDACILPPEVAAAEQAVRDGSAYRVDWGGLIWGLVEKEMTEVFRRDDGVCYFGAHLQRLIWAQKPVLFEMPEDGEKGEVVLEASVDAEMEEEDVDVDADVKSKSLEELESGDVDMKCKSLEKLDLGDADANCKGLEELESGNEGAKINGLEELELPAADVKENSLQESESGVVMTEAAAMAHETLTGSHEEAEVAAPEEGKEAEATAPPEEEVAVAAPSEEEATATEPSEEKAATAVPPEEETMAVPLEETMVVPPAEEVVAVPEEEEVEEEEEKEVTGLSLGIGGANDYDGMDVEGDANVENLDEGDTGNDEVESEDDAFEECKGGEEMNWRIGGEKGNEGMAHCLQRCNSSGFGNMEFENLSKHDLEIRDEGRFDDGFSGKMGSLDRMTSTDLLQAMNSIPATYNVVENVHDLSSGDFLAMGGNAHKNGADLGAGSSFFFGNNGKRHIGDIDGYNDQAQAQQQFPQSNQSKRMRNNGNNSMSFESADFNANFAEPIQSIMTKASMFYEQKERELQNALVEKQCLTDMLQQKDAIIQSLNSARFDQENKWQAELRRFEHDLNVMAQLVSGYKKALKQCRASFAEYRKKFLCDKPRYADVAGGGGLVLSVKELERQRLEEQQQKLAIANEMIEKFQLEWFSKLDEWTMSVQLLWSRKEALAREVDILKEKRTVKVVTPATEE